MDCPTKTGGFAFCVKTIVHKDGKKWHLFRAATCHRLPHHPISSLPLFRAMCHRTMEASTARHKVLEDARKYKGVALANRWATFASKYSHGFFPSDSASSARFQNPMSSLELSKKSSPKIYIKLYKKGGGTQTLHHLLH